MHADPVQIVLQVRSQCHIKYHLLLLSRQYTNPAFFKVEYLYPQFVGEGGNLIISRSSDRGKVKRRLLIRLSINKPSQDKNTQKGRWVYITS